MGKAVWKAISDRCLGVAPAVPLLMMAASLRYILQMGGILVTIQYWASTLTTGLNPSTKMSRNKARVFITRIFDTCFSPESLYNRIVNGPFR